MRERVVFRREYDPYAKAYRYLAVFPDDATRSGIYMAVSIWKSDGRPWRSKAREIPWSYYYNMTETVHKDDPIVDELVEILKYFYDGEYDVKERIA